MNEFVEELREMFPHHHITLQIFPGGGIIDLDACDECGSTESYSRSWSKKRNQTIEGTIKCLRSATR